MRTSQQPGLELRGAITTEPISVRGHWEVNLLIREHVHRPGRFHRVTSIGLFMATALIRFPFVNSVTKPSMVTCLSLSPYVEP